MIVRVSGLLRVKSRINKICLSGGVFQNMLLRKLTTERLEGNNFKVYNHKNIPPNDGGISAGQIAVAIKRF
jgi:hydrogenase maturation protein HypF